MISAFFLNLEFTRKAVTSMTSPLVRRSAYKQQEVLMIIKDDTTLVIILTKVNLFPKGVLRHFTRSPLQWVGRYPLLNQTILSIINSSSRSSF